MGIICREPVFLGKKLGYALLIAANPCPGSEPHRPLPVFADRLHHRIVRKGRTARNTKVPAVEHAEAAMCAYPETPFTIFEQRRHQFIREPVRHGVVGKSSIGKTAEPRMPCPDPDCA